MPSGFLLCNGASVSRSDYPDLAEALGETGTTFSLPDYRDRVPQGAGTVSPNVGVEASLPAITGAFQSRRGYHTDETDVFSGIIGVPSGVFSFDEECGGEWSYIIPFDHIHGLADRMALDASSSDSTYSGTAVQPSAWTAHFLIKA